jgi:tRNA-dependent cyclodipeptide synthase
MSKANAIQSIGINLEEIYNRQHNIWIGISFSNKIFNLENIKALLDFALTHTKDKVLILIPGRLQATNYYYFDKLSRSESLSKAFADEDNMKISLEKIFSGYSADKRGKILLANYDDVLIPIFVKRRELFYREFSSQGKLYNQVIDIASDILISRGREFDKKRAESLALYILQELPLFFGVQTANDQVLYSAIVYPGLDKIDKLFLDIINEAEYSELTKKLNLINKCGIIDIKFN